MKNKLSLTDIEIALKNEYYDANNKLRVFVANLCGIDSADILSVTDAPHIFQARWLYWYAMRYMTHDTYDRLSEITKIDGHRFGLRCIAKGVAQINELIESDSTWRIRWKKVKDFIKEMQRDDERENELLTQKHKIVINVPYEIKNNIEIEIRTEKKTL